MITASILARADVQTDGRTSVVEAHTDDTVGILRFQYVASADADLNATMAARATAYNAALAAVPTITVTQDDGTTNTLRTWDIPNTDLRLTAAQKSALISARNVIDAVRPFVRVYNSLTAAQQQFVLTHTPWFSQVLAVFNGA